MSEGIEHVGVVGTGRMGPGILDQGRFLETLNRALEAASDTDRARVWVGLWSFPSLPLLRATFPSEVVDDVLEVGDQGSLAVRTAVAHVVIGVDGGSASGELLGHVAVAAPMLTVAVDDLHDASRWAFRLPAPVEDAAF